jgi:sugar lactone lactonase YvrE
MFTKHVRGRTFNYEYCLGGVGLNGAGLFFPSDFALGPDRTLYVISKGYEFLPSQGITKFTLDSQLLWDSRGLDYLEGRGPFPSGVAVDSVGNVYVADEYTNGIYIFDEDGNPVGSWGADMPGGGGLGDMVFPAPNTWGIHFDLYLKKVGDRDATRDGELNGPTGMAFDAEDILYISDTYNHRIQVFTKDGRFLRNWGGFGSDEGKFNLPWHLTVDRENNVYVADWRNSRVQKFSPDGDFLASFGAPGSGEGELHRPSSVAVDSDGDVYVTDWEIHQLIVYEPDGSFLHRFEGDATELSAWTQAKVNAKPEQQIARKRADTSVERHFRRPTTVRVDAEGRIMVLESTASRIQVYVKERDWVEAQFNL